MKWIVSLLPKLKIKKKKKKKKKKKTKIDKAFVKERKRGIWGAATIIMLASHYHQAAETPMSSYLLVVSYDELITNKVL